MLGRAANFQSEDGSLINLVYASPFSLTHQTADLVSGFAALWQAKRTSGAEQLALGRGSELVLFLVSPVQLLRDQHHGLPWRGKSGCLLKIASSLPLFKVQEKKLPPSA